MRPNSHVPGILICAFLGALYVRTLAPGLTWAFDGADGGDLITAAATGGIPHPTGYPTYLLLASVFLKIPLGSLAFRTNLLSLVAAVLAAWLIYILMLAVDGSILTATVACLAFGTAPLIWSQAIITEVYTLQAVFAAAFLYLLLVAPRSVLCDWGLGLTAGLSIGNHLTGVLMLPLLLIGPSPSLDKVPSKSDSERLLTERAAAVFIRRFLGLCLGLGVYLIIPLRARSQAPVNWGNVHDLSGFAWLVSGSMYWSRLAQNTGSYLLSGFRAWAYFLVEQFTIFGLLIMLIGLLVLFKPSRLYVVSIWIAVAYSLFAIIYYSPDSYTLLTPAIISFSIWIGLASRWLAKLVSDRIRYGALISIALIMGFFVLRGLLSVRSMDLSNDRKVDQFAHAVLDAAPRNAILFTEGDEATFALWYFHYAYHERPDLAVVSSDLLEQPWYSDVLKHTYPGLVIPALPWGQELSQANPGRPFCRLAPDLQQPGLECSG